MHSSFLRFFVIVSLSVRLQFLLYEFSLYAHLAVCELNLYLICLGSVFDKRYKKNHTNLHGQLVESVLFCCWFWFVNFSFMLRERKWKEINSDNKLTKSESKQGLKTVFEEENLDENHKRNLTWLCVIFSTLVWLTILRTLSIIYHFVTVCACPKRIIFSFHLCFQVVYTFLFVSNTLRTYEIYILTICDPKFHLTTFNQLTNTKNETKRYDTQMKISPKRSLTPALRWIPKAKQVSHRKDPENTNRIKCVCQMWFIISFTKWRLMYFSFQLHNCFSFKLRNPLGLYLYRSAII